MPLCGVKSKTPQKLRLTWSSLRLYYSMFVILSLLGNTMLVSKYTSLLQSPHKLFTKHISSLVDFSSSPRVWQNDSTSFQRDQLDVSSCLLCFGYKMARAYAQMGDY